MPKKPFVPNVVDVASAVTCPRISLLKLVYGASGEYTPGLAIGTVTHSVLAELGRIEPDIAEKVDRARPVSEISNQIYSLWLEEARTKIEESWRVFADAKISAQEGRNAVLEKLRGFSQHLAEEVKRGYTRPDEIITGHHLIDLDLPLEGVPDEYRILHNPFRIEIREFKSYGGAKVNETNKLQACGYQLLLEPLYPNAEFTIRVYSTDNVVNVRMTPSRRKKLHDGIQTITQVYQHAYGPAKPIPRICAVCAVNHACNYYFTDTQPPQIRKYFWKLRMETLEEKGVNQAWKWKSRRLTNAARIELGITDVGYRIIKFEPKQVQLAKDGAPNVLPGETVIVSAGNPLTALSFTGEVSELIDNSVIVVPYGDIPLGLPSQGLSIDRYDVDLTRRQLRSVDAVHRATGRTSELARRLLGVDLPRNPTQFKEVQFIADLNPNQQEAVKLALSAQDYAVILGPPGTGKTLVIVEILAQLAREGKRALVVSITNPAVDNIVERLLFEGHKFGIRFGNWYKIRESVMQAALINILSNEQDMALAAVEKMRNAAAVLTTCSSASLDLVKAGRFDVIIFEEASQIRMQDAFSAIPQGEKMIIIGDDKQLPPVSQMNKPINSLLEIAQSTLTRNNLQSQLIRDLRLQYRMRQEICDLIDHSFYDGKLETAKHVRKRSSLYATINPIQPNQLNLILDPKVIIGVVDVEGMEEYRGASTYNLANVEVDLRLLNALKSTGISDNQIGLITPYKEQHRILTKAIGRGNIVGTVDSFQGQERDIIILDLVRANPDREVGFILQPKRMNVALSRAREKLIVVGNLETCPGFDTIINRIRSLPNTRIEHVTANELGIKLPKYKKRAEIQILTDLTNLEEPHQKQPPTNITPPSGYFDIY
jgi:ATP-dependent RNA/DNA helicase IGHMBP2